MWLLLGLPHYIDMVNHVVNQEVEVIMYTITSF